MQGFPAELCILSPRATASVPGDGNSLENLTITDLPDGALVWVTAEKSFYRLDKTSLFAPLGAVVAPAIIVPFGDASQPGRWFQIPNALTNSSLGGDVLLTASGEGQVLLAPTLNTWVALASGSAFYTSEITSSLWTLDASTGILTYHGVSPARYTFRGYISAAVNTGTASELDFTVDINGAVVGTTTLVPSSGDQFTANSAKSIAISFEHVAQISQGTAIRAAIRNRTTGTPQPDITITRMHLVALPVG